MNKSLNIFCISFQIFLWLIGVGSCAIQYCESHAPNANIKTMSDALWWSLNICSVGDASLYPVTNAGRIVGAILIIGGYSCFALNIGIISAWISHIIKHED